MPMVVYHRTIQWPLVKILLYDTIFDSQCLLQTSALLGNFRKLCAAKFKPHILFCVKNKLKLYHVLTVVQQECDFDSFSKFDRQLWVIFVSKIHSSVFHSVNCLSMGQEYKSRWSYGSMPVYGMGSFLVHILHAKNWYMNIAGWNIQNLPKSRCW